MQVIKIKSAIRDYEVNFSETTDFLSKLETIRNRFYIIDSTVWDLYAEKLFSGLDMDRVMILPINEDRKNIDTVMEVYDVLMSRSAKRNMTLISIGGGIVQDITGFAASTLYRGINWVFIPTTLLAQADSCIGSKTSLNYKSYKNLVGSFFLNASFLKTLTKEDFFSGLGEVIKLHLMGGADSTALLRTDIKKLHERDEQAMLRAINTSLEVKLSYMQEDEFDTGKRNLLNFGHCYGHALEATSNFSIPHGQAVLVGILFANVVAKNRGLLKPETFIALNTSVIKPTIVAKLNVEYFNTGRIFAAMKMDKKRIGEGLVLVMLVDDHKMIKVSDLSLPELESAAAELLQIAGVS